MCYDISFSTKIQKVTEFIPNLKGLEQLSIDFHPTYHQVAQTFPEWPIVLHKDGPLLVKAEWGIVAPYMKTPDQIAELRKLTPNTLYKKTPKQEFASQRNYMVNARSEKILDKNAYWNKIRHKRCLIPLTGYFEHREVPTLKNKVPFFVKLNEKELGFIAGLYTLVRIGESKEMKLTFTLITRPANTLLRVIHNSGDNPFRMPHVLPPKLQHGWIDPALTDAGIAEILDYEVPSDALDAWPVHTIRGKNRLEGPAIIQKKAKTGLEEIFVYRFRADFMSQIDRLKAVMPNAEFETKPSIVTPPDVDAWLYTNLHLNQVLQTMNQVKDISVLIETLDYAKSYTGDRKYERGKGDWTGELFG